MNEPILPQIVPITNKKIKDIAGQRFGRLFVVGYVGNQPMGTNKQSFAAWLCQCDCGNSKVIVGSSLRSGLTQSCGCLQKERTGNTARKHGLTHSPERKAWSHMMERCYNPSIYNFCDYGGRDIHVCERWRNSFEDFYADMGPKPARQYSLDRIDVNGNYEPSNCRWATPIEQANNKRTNHRITVDEKTHTIAEWARLTGVTYGYLGIRIRRRPHRKVEIIRELLSRKQGSEEQAAP